MPDRTDLPRPSDAVSPAPSPAAEPARPRDQPLVLAVDDTEGNRYAITHVLRGAGMRVLEASSGADALRLAATALPDLVVLDINLPDMSGYEVCRGIKQNSATAWIPVMHVSASYTTNSDRAFGLEAGADAYLTHPIDPAVFLATTRALLRVGQAEAQLGRAAAEWQATFDSLADAVFLLDARGTVRRCNAAAAQLVARGAGAVVGEPLVALLEGAMGAATDDVLADAARGTPLRQAEVRLGERWFAVSTNAVRDADAAAAMSTVCVLTDIGPRKAAERERELLLAHSERARADADAARREAESANRAKSDFLAVMSHELRTPLNAIGGFVELLEMGIRGPVTEVQLADLQKIRRSKDVLLGLINDLLSFAKLESGAVHYAVADVRLHDVLQQSGEFLEPQMTMNDIALVHDTVDPALYVRADADKLQQVLLNLLSNAIKFTPAGGTVTIGCDADDAQVAVRVTDTGRGIPTDRLEAIFDPFVQVDQRMSRDREGIGLGLAISRELAQGMGGALTVESELGRGSTFTVTLPRAASGARPPEA